MKKTFLYLFALLPFVLFSFASTQKPSASPVYVFEHVNVIPMTENRLWRNQTVVVAEGKISCLGAAENAAIPKNAIRIPARDKYLLPGLIDCYTHVHEKSLLLDVANGVTTVVNAIGAPFQHGLKKLVDEGKIFGPRIFSVGPPIASLPLLYHTQGAIKNADEARFAVRETKRMGYDAVFVYVNIDSAAYKAVLDEAGRLGLPIKGHVPYKIPFDVYAAGSQLSFDNLVGLMNLQTGETYPEARLAAMATALRANNKYVVPTLTIHKARALAGKADSLADRATMKYEAPRQRAYWHLSSSAYKYDGAARIVKTFYENGVKLLIGTDGGFHFVQHGFSYFEEMKNFSALGIPNYDVLRAATHDAAEYLGWQDKIGTIEAGKEADLILLEANPLENLDVLEHRAGVMLRGQWHPAAELSKKLNALEAEWKALAKADRFSNIPKPEGRYQETARYEIYFKDVLCGEERIFQRRDAQGNAWLFSQNRIDPPCARFIAAEWKISPDKKIQSLFVQREGIEGLTKMKIERKEASCNIIGNVPLYGDVNLTEPLASNALLGGPNTSINLDMDVIGNFQVLVQALAHLEAGRTDSLMMKKVELNNEEWSHDALIGDVMYQVKRLDDRIVEQSDEPTGGRTYQIKEPGFNGSPNFSFTAVVEVDDNGWISSVVFDDHVRVKRVK